MKEYKKRGVFNMLYATRKETQHWNDGYKQGYKNGRIYQKDIDERAFDGDAGLIE